MSDLTQEQLDLIAEYDMDRERTLRLIRDHAKNRVEETESLYSQVKKLIAANCPIKDLSSYGRFHVTREQLPAIVRIVGQMEEWSKEAANRWSYVPEGMNRDKAVLITLRPKSEEYNKVYFFYWRELEPGDPCQIVTETSVTRSLVCNAKK